MTAQQSACSRSQQHHRKSRTSRFTAKGMPAEMEIDMFLKKFYVTFIALLSSLFLLSGCSQPQEDITADSPTGKNGSSAPVSEEGTWTGLGGCYKISPVEPEETYTGLLVYEDELYTTVIDMESEDISMRLQRGPDTLYETSFIEALTAGASGIWLAADITDYSQSDLRKYQLVQLNREGQVLLEKDISEQLQDAYPVDMQADSQGRVALLLDQSVILFHSDGSVGGSISLEGSGICLALGGDGMVYAVLNRGSSQGMASSAYTSSADSSVFRLNMEDLTAEYVTSYEGYRICSGREDYLLTLLNNDGLYGVTDISAEPVPVALWDELGMSFPSPASIQWMSGGQFLLYDRTLPAIVSPAEPSEIKPKTMLTIATTFAYSSFGSILSEFNMHNQEYVVKLVDYTKNGTVPSSDAIQALNMDIMAGNAPDMLDMTYIPQSYYTDKGLLADLSGYLENDPQIGPDDFILLDKLKTDGGLYFVPVYYYLETASGLESVFGSRAGVSLEDYLDLQSRYSGEIIYNVTQESFLNTLASRYVANHVDWENGTCDFESEEFIKILESVLQIRENPESDNPAELDFTPGGKRLAEGSLILCYQFVDNVLSLAQAEEEAGEPLSFVGLPTPDGIGGSVLNPCSMAGILKQGQADASWQFIKYLLTAGAEETAGYGITVNKEIWERQIEKALSASADTEDYIPFDEADVAKLYDLFDRCVYYGTASQEILNIIQEEASAMFAGAKSARETAHVIQSRAGILVAE